MNQEVSYICDVCKDKLSAKIRKSKKYCRVYSFESSFVCAECSKIFGMAYEVTEKKHNRQDQLQLNHFIQSKRIDSGEIPCTEHESERRMTKDSQDKLYNCHQCDKNFKTKNGLYCHKFIHEGRFKCKICNKCSQSKGDLNIHIQKHSNLRPHKCSDCPKAFKFLRGLKAHRRVHDKSNPFKCEMCKKTCESESDLRRHMELHYGERPHKCSMCQKAFKRKQHLVRHMKNHRKQDDLHPGKGSNGNSD